MPVDPFFVLILLLAAWPSFAVSRSAGRGWRAGVVFAAFYPAFLILGTVLLISLILLVVPLGLFEID